jgi:hypothetical protein
VPTIYVAWVATNEVGSGTEDLKWHGDRTRLTIRAIILSSAFLFSLRLFAQESKDAIMMKNDDRFTCEIKGLGGGILPGKLSYVGGTRAG